MTITDRVRAILKADPASRNDDKRLMIVYMQKSDMNLSDEQIAAFYKMDNLWTVRRERQKIQEAGEYPPDPAVAVARKAKAEYTRQKAKGSAQDLEAAITAHPQLKVFMEPAPEKKFNRPRPLDWKTDLPIL